MRKLRVVIAKPGLDGHDLDVFAGEGQFDDALNGDAVIGKEQLARH